MLDPAAGVVVEAAGWPKMDEVPCCPKPVLWAGLVANNDMAASGCKSVRTLRVGRSDCDEVEWKSVAGKSAV